MSNNDADVPRLRKERDLYLNLLRLGTCNEMGSLLDDALALVVGVTGAENGYIEFRDENDEAAQPRWSMSCGFAAAAVDDVRAAISRGVVGEAIATGRTVRSASAAEDPRFKDRASVQSNRVEAVLCAPIGESPPAGVVYLQGRRDRVQFTDDDVAALETFARHVEPIARRALADERDKARRDATRGARAKLRADGIVGTSAALGRVLDAVALVAPLDVDVLLTGPTGGGKSEVARALHANSRRAAGPFVEINCAALPVDLVESELFGALPGAHSTAQRRIVGKVGAAEGGVLFIDEVGELPLVVQPKLLQLIQEKSYYPLGSAKPERADVRILAATNVDLDAAVKAGTFRADLFYRLNVIPLRVPGLADRREDVPALVKHFLASACARHGFGPFRAASATVHAAETADWPGNIRQLSNAVEAAAIRCHGEGADVVQVRHLFPDVQAADAERDQPTAFAEATRRFQRQLLLDALEAADWNVPTAAARLDLARSHLYTLIASHGLRAVDDPRSKDGRS